MTFGSFFSTLQFHNSKSRAWTDYRSVCVFVCNHNSLVVSLFSLSSILGGPNVIMSGNRWTARILLQAINFGRFFPIHFDQHKRTKIKTKINKRTQIVCVKFEIIDTLNRINLLKSNAQHNHTLIMRDTKKRAAIILYIWLCQRHRIKKINRKFELP